MGSAEPLREAIIASVLERASRNGGFVTRADLVFPMPDGDNLALVGRSRGIRNPREIDTTLSMMISSP